MARDKRSWVDEDNLSDALERHVEALFKRRAGSDATPYKHDPDTAQLFRLNRQLYQTLIPVEPSESFVDQLKAELIERAGHRQPSRRIEDRASQVRAAISIFTVAAFAFRILASVAVIIALIITQRRRRSAAPA